MGRLIFSPVSRNVIFLTGLSSSLKFSYREELDKYWQQIIIIDKITEFQKHHCSHEIKEFLNFDTVAMKTKVSVIKIIDKFFEIFLNVTA